MSSGEMEDGMGSQSGRLPGDATPRAVIERIIRGGVSRGEFEAADPAEAAACIHAGFVRYTHPLLIGLGSLQPEPSLEAMTAFLLRSLAPRGTADAGAA